MSMHLSIALRCASAEGDALKVIKLLQDSCDVDQPDVVAYYLNQVKKLCSNFDP